MVSRCAGAATASTSTACASRRGRVLVRVNPRYFRPAEVDLLHGDATLARTELGWAPETSFAALVREMVDHDAPVA